MYTVPINSMGPCFNFQRRWENSMNNPTKMSVVPGVNASLEQIRRTSAMAVASSLLWVMGGCHTPVVAAYLDA